MPPDKLARYALALAHTLRLCRWVRYHRADAVDVLCSSGLTAEEADEVITHGLAHGILTSSGPGLVPTSDVVSAAEPA